MPSPQSQQKQQSQKPADICEWIKEGAVVTNSYYGEGTILSIDGRYIKVRFQDGDSTFSLPNAVINGYIKKAIPKDSTARKSEKNDQIADIASPDMTDEEGAFEELVSQGFTCIDNRVTSSIIWVIYEEEKKELFMRIVLKYHVPFKFERRGAMATDGKAAWRIMC